MKLKVGLVSLLPWLPFHPEKKPEFCSGLLHQPCTPLTSSDRRVPPSGPLHWFCPFSWNSQPAVKLAAYSLTSFRTWPKYHLVSKVFLDRPGTAHPSSFSWSLFFHSAYYYVTFHIFNDISYISHICLFSCYWNRS